MIFEGTRDSINDTIRYQSVVDCRGPTTKGKILRVTYSTMREVTLGIRELIMNDNLMG